MRFPRSTLLERGHEALESHAAVLEAPEGFGKSWLLRRLVPRGTEIGKGTLGALPAIDDDQAWIVVDDAHRLDEDELELLADAIEDGFNRVVVAGRLVTDRLRRAVRLSDGLYLGPADLAVSGAEFSEALATANLGPTQRSALSDDLVNRLLEVTGGAIGLIDLAVGDLAERAGGDPVATVLQQRRLQAQAVIRRLAPIDRSIVGALARVPGLDAEVVERLAGEGAVRRLVDAGAPVQRSADGRLSLHGAGDGGAVSRFESAEVDADLAVELSDELADRGDALAGINLLLDAGARQRAVESIAAMTESDAESIGPAALSALLSRLGAVVDADPRLLLLRALAAALTGHESAAMEDLERAADLVAGSDSELERRIAAQHGVRLAFAGRGDEARAAAARALRGLASGEERTLARAHVVLATLAQAEDSREGLQRAADEYRLAADAWAAAGEPVKARFCRSDLSMAALCPLGRFDEALVTLTELLETPDVGDIERSWFVLSEGFALLYANRLDAATARFARVADLGKVQSNPRLAAAAAWGRAIVSSRQGDLAATVRWLAQAENTALGDDDDTLGVPFLCDAAVNLGALGADDRAEEYFRRAAEREGVYRSFVARTRFIVEARRGIVGDRAEIDARLALSPPWEWWRILLVAAAATAEGGDRAEAIALLHRAEFELLGLGFGDFESVGEAATYGRLRRRLAGEGDSDPDAGIEADEQGEQTGPNLLAGPANVATGAERQRLSTTHIEAFGPSLTVHTADGVADLPPGNPQRLAAVVVAFGGAATFDQIADAMWPGEPIATTRARLRNVLMRLRKAIGDAVVRSGNGVRLAPGVTCDLMEFSRLADDSMTYVRSDPDLAGALAERAVALAHGPLLAEFEYEEWSLTVRRRTEQQLLGLLDLLSVQAQDTGDLARAQQLAERALRLDRYTDSRYLRLADLMALDGRRAAALAVLADAGEVANELGGLAADELERRRSAFGGPQNRRVKP